MIFLSTFDQQNAIVTFCRMKKACAILLVAFLSYSYFGYFLVMSLDREMVAEKIRENILPQVPDNQLVLFRVVAGQPSGIRWLNRGKEFLYHWSMYDVVRTRTSGDTTLFYCYNDRHEARVLANLYKMIREQTDHARSKRIIRNLTLTFFFQEPTTPFTYSSFFTLLFFPESQFQSVPPAIPSPPPWSTGLHS